MTFQEVLRTLGIQFVEGKQHHHSRPGWINLDCSCGPGSGKYHLGYNLSSGFLTCWKCGPKQSGRTLAFLSGKPIQVVMQLLEGVPKVHIKEFEHLGKLQLPEGVGPLLTPHINYLESRGLDADSVVRWWGVKGIGLAAELSWRLFIPVFLHGKMVSWTTRSIAPKAQRRYLSAKSEQEAVPHKHLLYGEEYCYHTVIVHEGPADVWKTGPGAVCTFGTEWSMKQVARLAKYPRAVICFDNTPDGKVSADKLADQLCPLTQVELAFMQTAKDAGGADPWEIQELRKRYLE